MFDPYTKGFNMVSRQTKKPWHQHTLQDALLEALLVTLPFTFSICGVKKYIVNAHLNEWHGMTQLVDNFVP